ncbi:unnamed protein product [Camellia sinensis]
MSLWRCFRYLGNQILACTLGKSCTYRQLPHTATMLSLSLVASERGFETPDTPCGCCEHSRNSSDLVALKISLLRDSQIGKTSFLASAFVFCFLFFFVFCFLEMLFYAFVETEHSILKCCSCSNFFFLVLLFIVDKVCWGRKARRRI